MKRLARIAAVLTAAGICMAPAMAQTTTATLTGTVRSADGTGAPGIVIEARNTSIGMTRSAATDIDGRYRIDLLPPGTWAVTARQAGQLVADVRTISLSLQQTGIVDFTVGSVKTETITVNAEAPLVDPSRLGSELRVDGTQVDDLPINGRNLTDLALLDSSVSMAAAGNFYGERGSVFVVNGQSGRANSFLVDGLDNNDQSSNTTLNAFLSQQVIREFVVMTHQFAPEFGRASGGILNIVTERGGNDFTGGGFLQGSVPGLNSPGEFVSSLPEQDGRSDTSGRYQTGVRFGGPFKRDQSSWFAAYEHQESNDVTPYTGVDRHGTEGGWVLAPGHDDNFFLRTDFNLGARNFLMARLSGDIRRTTELNVGAEITPEAGFSVDERDVQLAASLTSVLSGSVSNEARLLVGRSGFDQSANSDRPGVERPSGTFGGNNLNRQNRTEDRIQLVDNISWQTGRHALKFGADVMRSWTDVETAFNPNGNFLYDTDQRFEPGDCGDLYFSLINDPANHVDPNNINSPVICPGVVGVDDDGDGTIDEPGIIQSYPEVFQLIEGKPAATLDDTRLALFAQDTWDLSSHLKLNYGVRYDLSTFVLPSSARVDSTIPNGGAGRDTNNIAPRFGFTWTPGKNARTVVRGGGGIFYDKLALGFPAVAAITSGTQIGLFFPQGLTVELTEDLVEQLGINTIKPALIFPENLILRFSTGTELETPYTTQFNLGMEQAAGLHGAWSAAVTRTQGYHMVLLEDLNPVFSRDVNGIPIHADPNVGSIASIVTEGRTWYTALDLGWRWRGDDAWYSVSYTWSKALDEGPDPLKGGISMPAFCEIAADPAQSTPDPCAASAVSHSLSDERGRTDSDRRHRIVFSGATPLPLWGLRVSGAIQLATGIPFNVTTGRDENIDGITTDRPRGVARNTGARTSLKAINDYRVAHGLSKVHNLSEPRFAQVDMRLSRPLGLHGEAFLQVFNLLDRENAGTLDGAVTSNHFGETVTLAGPPRTVELGLKLAF